MFREHPIVRHLIEPDIPTQQAHLPIFSAASRMPRRSGSTLGATTNCSSKSTQWHWPQLVALIFTLC
jgi:hypothetical protein